MKKYWMSIAMCLLLSQFCFGQSLVDDLNLLTDSSCEANAAGGDTHFVNTWIVDAGAVQCFNANSFLIPTANASEGGFFFADASSTANLSQISQVVDLGQDRSGVGFFYSYEYRMSDMIARPTHTLDVEIEFLNNVNTTIGLLHSKLDFTDATPDLVYKVESGTGTAPAGTSKIKWTARWEDNGTYNEMLLDNFILRHTSDQCVGVPDFPYFCFSDPLMIDGDVIQMTCAQFFDDNYLNSLINVSQIDICDEDGKIKIRRPRSSNLKGTGAEKSMTDCILAVDFAGENFADPASDCENALTLQVEITGTITPAITAPPSVVVPCNYDLADDPQNILGAPTNIIGFEDGFTDSGSTSNCGGQVTRTWQATDCCGNTFATDIQIINIAAAVPNNLCENAIPIQCGNFILGDNLSATTANNMASTGVFTNGTCPTPNFSVFYSFLGTGKTMKISTDYPATNFDTRLSVYSGTCNAPVCVAQGDDISFTDNVPPCLGSNIQTEITFATVQGQTYYLMLDGTTGCIADRGLFGFSVECLYDAALFCEDIISGTTVGGSSFFLAGDYLGCGDPYTYSGNDYAYTIEANQLEFYRFTLTPSTADLDIFVFELDAQGNIISCEGSSLLSGTSQEEIEVQLDPGTYLVVIDAINAGVESSFDLEVECQYSTEPKFTAQLELNVLLQGSYGTPSMNTALRASNLLPSTDPYGLGTAATYGIFGNFVDWVIVELRDPIDNTQVVARQACLLRQDGRVFSADYDAYITFPDIAVSEAYIVIKHRNHLGVMTNAAIAF